MTTLEKYDKDLRDIVNLWLSTGTFEFYDEDNSRNFFKARAVDVSSVDLYCERLRV